MPGVSAAWHLAREAATPIALSDDADGSHCVKVCDVVKLYRKYTARPYAQVCLHIIERQASAVTCGLQVMGLSSRVYRTVLSRNMTPPTWRSRHTHSSFGHIEVQLDMLFHECPYP